MARQSVDWESMFRALDAFKKEHGHCRVPANWKKNPQLGRWVAMQRYRHKIGELEQRHVDRLNQAGFVWAPADTVWGEMLGRLKKYHKKHGDCDVPSSCPSDPNLANWVANQRHRRKMGSLSADRVKMLDELSFLWAVYGKNRAGQEQPMNKKTVSAPVKVVAQPPEERLYQVCGEYIQYNGTGPLPVKLEKFIASHNGDFPPCILLPRHPLTFRIGNGDSVVSIMRKYEWPGKGPLPDDILEYLNENGALPPHGP